MMQAYPVTMCSKFAALRRRGKFHINQIVDVTINCGLRTAIQPRAGFLAEIAKYRAVGDYSGSFGARVANCSSCGFAGRLLQVLA